MSLKSSLDSSSSSLLSFCCSLSLIVRCSSLVLLLSLLSLHISYSFLPFASFEALRFSFLFLLLSLIFLILLYFFVFLLLPLFFFHFPFSAFLPEPPAPSFLHLPLAVFSLFPSFPFLSPVPFVYTPCVFVSFLAVTVLLFLSAISASLRSFFSSLPLRTHSQSLFSMCYSDFFSFFQVSPSPLSPLMRCFPLIYY